MVTDEDNKLVHDFLNREMHNDKLIMITTNHLFSEYILNKIIENKCPTPRIILGDRRYSYSLKLNLIYSMGWLPEFIYQDLLILNKLRNSYAHNLNPDFSIFQYYNEDLEEVKIDKTENRHEYLDFIDGLCFNVIGALINYVRHELHIDIPKI